MKILIVHNEYSIHGGEDEVVEKYFKYIQQYGINVKLYKVSNRSLNNASIVKKIHLFFKNIRMKRLEHDLSDILNEYAPDIVHIHNVYPLITPRIYYEAKKRNIKIVQTLHNYRFICPNGLLFRNGKICEICSERKNLFHCFINKCYRNSYLQSFWYAYMITKARNKGWFQFIDRFIALNPFIVNKMIENGYEKSKFVIIPNGIERTVRNKNIEKKEYLLYIGRLSNEKGILTLIKAVNKTEYTLLIAGTGPLEQSIYDYIKNNDRVKLLEFVCGEEKEKLISEAKAVIEPSECYDNSPTVVIESFSYGVPVIVSEIGGVQFMVQENSNGYKFKAGNVEDLFEKINLLFQDNNYDHLCNGALATFEEKYEKNIIMNKLIILYNELLQEKFSGGGE